MKLATATILLPALALAQDRAKFTGQFRASGTGCPPGSVSVVLGGSGEVANEVAEVSLRDYRVQIGPNIPPTEQNKQCQVFLDIRFPLGCSNITFSNSLTGPVQLDPGATGTYQRAYVLPTAQFSPVNGNRPANLQFTSASFPDFIQNDRFSARVTIQSGAPSTLPYSLEGGLSLQRGPINNSNGTLANDVWAVSIATQAACCKSTLGLLSRAVWRKGRLADTVC